MAEIGGVHQFRSDAEAKTPEPKCKCGRRLVIMVPPAQGAWVCTGCLKSEQGCICGIDVESLK